MKRAFTEASESFASPPKKIKSVSTFVSTFRESITKIEDFLQRRECADCRKEITKSVRIEMESPHQVVCYSCFLKYQSKGIVNYIAHDRLNYHVYSTDWTAIEELLLMQGLEKYGVDNWNEIADHIATKSSKDCEIHYYAFYYKSKSIKIPDNDNDIICKRNEKGQLEIIASKSKAAKKLVDDYKEQHAEISEPVEKDQPNPALENEFMGYNPLRKEFNIEHDNDAELLLSELEFFDDDKIQEKRLKFEIIDLYNQRLDERIKRKNFVIERELVDVKKIQGLEKRKNKREKEIFQSIKMFMRFLSKDEFDLLLANLAEEQELKQRIEELKYFKYADD